MSLIRPIRCASAPLDHRLAVGDGQTMLRDAKTGLGSPQPPLGAHLLSCPIGAIPVAQPTAELIRLVSIAHTTNGLDSNPQSTRPPPARGGRHLITLNRIGVQFGPEYARMMASIDIHVCDHFSARSEGIGIPSLVAPPRGSKGAAPGTSMRNA